MAQYNFDSKNNSIATILRRKKLNDNLYQFTYEEVVTGYLDQKRGVFVDSNGKEYYSITNPEVTKYKNNKAFSSYLEKDDLNLVFSMDEDVTYDYLINKYKEYVKSLMYFLKVFKDKKNNNKVSIKEINLNSIEEYIDKTFRKNDKDDFYFLEEIMFDGSFSDDYLDEDFYLNSSFIDDMSQLITDIYNCDYNASELFTIVSNLQYVKEYLETTLNTIDLQLHAYYNKDKKPRYPTAFDEEFVNSDYDPYAFDTTVFDEYEESFFEQDKIIAKKMDLIKIRDEIKKYLINQDEALRRVLVELARMDLKDNEKNKGILLLGDSGTGKTYLMELLAKNMDVPFLIVDSTQLTIPGYVGKDINEYLWDLYEDCDRDLEKAEKAIIFFDEIDKKGSNRKSDISGQGVLNVLLKFLDGTTYEACQDVKKRTEVVQINTSKMKIIAGGAFNDVFNDEYKKNSIGFTSNPEDEEKSMNIPDADVFVQKAFMTYEFMGRFPIRIKLNSHTIDSLETILKESEDSTLKEEQKAFNKLGVKLSVTPGFIKMASSNAIKLKTGVRGLMSCIEEATWMAFEDVYNNYDQYEEILLTDETLNDPSNYQKVYKK